MKFQSCIYYNVLPHTEKGPKRKTRECQALVTQASPSVCYTLVFLPPQGGLINLFQSIKKSEKD